MTTVTYEASSSDSARRLAEPNQQLASRAPEESSPVSEPTAAAEHQEKKRGNGMKTRRQARGHVRAFTVDTAAAKNESKEGPSIHFHRIPQDASTSPGMTSSSPGEAGPCSRLVAQ